MAHKFQWNFNEKSIILIHEKNAIKMLSAKCWQFCLSLNVLRVYHAYLLLEPEIITRLSIIGPWEMWKSFYKCIFQTQITNSLPVKLV